jgi:2-C-methyl-D-erythritol 2,4-cyclodiphosphate synthase
MRVGLGYDVHGFDSSRTLQLGGVTIEGAPGLAGWSDADVICHAIMDALLGAAGLGDAGRHFPEEAVPEGASSLELLVQTSKLLAAAGFRIVNVDCTVAIQDIIVGPHSDLMKSRIAQAIGIDPAEVNVGATTTDRLGFVGKGEGAAAMAVALVEKES